MQILCTLGETIRGNLQNQALFMSLAPPGYVFWLFF